MPFSVRRCDLSELESLRQEYRAEMRCQIIHDSIHDREGWSQEYALALDGVLVGYGSLAVAGPWRHSPAIYEFYLHPAHRGQVFTAFESFVRACGARQIETQTNASLLSMLLHTYSPSVQTEAVLFEDRFETRESAAGACVRATVPADIPALTQYELDTGARFVLTVEDEPVGAGGVLYHYNRPYGDIYMKIAEPFRRRGLGSYLVQELKRICRDQGSVPAARCNIKNEASRRTLQRAGFVPCGNLVSGKLG